MEISKITLKNNYKVTSDRSERSFSSYIEAEKISDSSKWIIKQIKDKNHAQWVLHNYVGNKIAQAILGPDLISDVEIIYDEQSRQTLIASRKIDNLMMFRGTEKDILSRSDYSLPFPFYCVQGGCKIESKGEKVKIVKGKYDKPSTLDGKPIYGIELANIMSIFINDEDINAGQNFALIPYADHYQVTRYDLDDSFKWFDNLEISKGILAMQSKSPLIRVSGEFYYFAQYTDFRKHKAKNIDNIISAIDKILGIGIERILSIVDDAFENVKTYFSDGDIRKLYNLKQLDCIKYPHESSGDFLLSEKPDYSSYCAFNKNDSNLDKLKNSIKYFLSRRYEDLHDMRKCAVVENALLANNLVTISKMIDDHELDNGEVICKSLSKPVLASEKLAIIPESIYQLCSQADPIKECHRFLQYKMKSIESYTLKNFATELGGKSEASLVFHKYFHNEEIEVLSMGE